jgi:hypothetical protein
MVGTPTALSTTLRIWAAARLKKKYCTIRIGAYNEVTYAISIKTEDHKYRKPLSNAQAMSLMAGMPHPATHLYFLPGDLLTRILDLSGGQSLGQAVFRSLPIPLHTGSSAMVARSGLPERYLSRSSSRGDATLNRRTGWEVRMANVQLTARQHPSPRIT